MLVNKNPAVRCLLMLVYRALVYHATYVNKYNIWFDVQCISKCRSAVHY